MPASSEAQGNTSSNANPSLDSLNGGGQVDYQQIFEKTNADLSQTKSELERTQRDLGETRQAATKANQAFERIQKAVMGDDGQVVDPVQAEIAELEKEADEYLAAAIQAEKDGRPIPLTVNNAIKRIQFSIKAIKENADLKRNMGEMSEKIKNLSNPGMRIDETAFGNMDSILTQALETIYGPEDFDVKQSQFDATSKRIGNEIIKLKKEQPEIWDRIRRDHTAQRKMVNHFVKQQIPPRAREVMETEHIRQTPLSKGELYAAYQEAKVLAQRDPSKKGYVQKIREDLLSAMYEESVGRRGPMRQLYNETR